MHRSVLDVVSFIEGPIVEGSRDWPLDLTLELLTDAKTVLPDIGIAPKVLLLSAARRRVVSVDTGPFISLEHWLAVRDA